MTRAESDADAPADVAPAARRRAGRPRAEAWHGAARRGRRRVAPAIYLDCNATTPLAPEVREAMLPFLRDDGGQPLEHPLGGRRGPAPPSRTARRRWRSSLGCTARRVVFTGSGTEADNLAVRGVAWRAGATAAATS